MKPASAAQPGPDMPPVCPDMPRAAVVVACGGVGARFGARVKAAAAGGVFGKGVPWEQEIAEKQFLVLAGRPVLAHTLSLLENHPCIGPVVLVLPEGSRKIGEELVAGRWPAEGAAAYPKVSLILSGGKNRQESVEKGLDALLDAGWHGIVLIHDGVRPCTPARVFDRVIDGVRTRGNAVAAIPVRDTLKRAETGGIVRETVDRRNLWQIQTPQGFWTDELAEAYREGRRRGLEVTDDAGLMEAMGRPVYLVEGDPANIKLTYPEDMPLLEALLLCLE